MSSLKRQIKRQLREFQTYVPGLIPAKFAATNFASKHTGAFIDPEFEAIGRLGPVKLAIDVGGNRGQSIVALQRLVKPERIVSFEPNPVLARQLAAAFPDVDVQPLGLSNVPGQFTLHVPSYRGFEFDGFASMNHEDAVGFLTTRNFARFDPSKISVRTYEVEVGVLDKYAFDPQVIKVDVQGLEDEVIEGAMETIRRSRPAIIIETPSKPLVALMQSIGLHPYQYLKGSLTPYAWKNKNALFLHDEAARRFQR
jgi:FkbM family methyltransferase